MKRLLGNVAEIQNFLRITKINLWSNLATRGRRVHLHTLVDRKRKRYDNTVDVVVRLHDRPILVPKVRHLRDLHTFGSVTSHELTIQ